MNYDPNTTHWLPGSIVLHDADAKEPRMVMKVIGYDRQGLCMTRYITGGRKRTRHIYHNELKYLHDVECFGFRQGWADWCVDLWLKIQDNYELVRWWNRRHAPGTEVIAEDPAIRIETRTLDRAYLDRAGQALVALQGSGLWLLQFVKFSAEGSVRKQA